MPVIEKWLNGFSKQGLLIYCAFYRIVLVTKYKRRILKGGIGSYLRISLKLTGRHYPDIKILKTITGENYLYLLISVPPKISVSQTVDLLKINTAKALKDRFRFLSHLRHGTGEIWSTGCLISTMEISEEVIKKYVQYQGDEDYGQSQFQF
jgi:REP element-mobilizing transposase RayT